MNFTELLNKLRAHSKENIRTSIAVLGLFSIAWLSAMNGEYHSVNAQTIPDPTETTTPSITETPTDIPGGTIPQPTETPTVTPTPTPEPIPPQHTFTVSVQDAEGQPVQEQLVMMHREDPHLIIGVNTGLDGSTSDLTSYSFGENGTTDYEITIESQQRDLAATIALYGGIPESIGATTGEPETAIVMTTTLNNPEGVVSANVAGDTSKLDEATARVRVDETGLEDQIAIEIEPSTSITVSDLAQGGVSIDTNPDVQVIQASTHDIAPQFKYIWSRQQWVFC